jgi:hypothetical protein
MMSQRVLIQYCLAFAAGFMSTLVFHQGMLALLYTIRFVPIAPYPSAPTSPFGVPIFWSLAFWGGIWGIGLALLLNRFPQRLRYWVVALLFGMLAPTLVTMLVVFPLKGVPVTPNVILLGLMLNAAWGLGTAFFLQFQGRS